jgi:hypothetical protein
LERCYVLGKTLARLASLYPHTELLHAQQPNLALRPPVQCQNRNFVQLPGRPGANSHRTSSKTVALTCLQRDALVEFNHRHSYSLFDTYHAHTATSVDLETLLSDIAPGRVLRLQSMNQAFRSVIERICLGIALVPDGTPRPL